MNKPPGRFRLDPRRLRIEKGKSTLRVVAPHSLVIDWQRDGAIHLQPLHAPGVDREGLARGLAQLVAFLIENPGFVRCIAGTCDHRAHESPA